MPYFVIPDISELMVRMMIIMGLVTRKITGAQTIQVIDDIDDDGDNIVGDFDSNMGEYYLWQKITVLRTTCVLLGKYM